MDLIFETAGTILVLFIGFIILIILLPIIISVVIFLSIRNKSNKPVSLWSTIKESFSKILSSLGAKAKSAKNSPQASGKMVDNKGNKIEDAEFTELPS